tara:strand:- start:20401 stop:22215 length:1815 start_codon:yes stop_codon:yes gene_type:complete
MKNLLLISCLVLTAGITWSQKAPRIASLDELIGTEKPALNIEHLKDEGITIWSDDFSDETTWVLDNSGQQGVEYGWNINAVSDGWYSTNGIGSTSGGNYAELVNGDPFAETQALDVVYTMTTANPIDVITLAGTNEITLEFEQFGARFNDLQQISYSTDGVVFTPIGDNNDIPVLSASGGSAYDNPDLKQINLATVLDMNSSPIWLQFSWTTNFPASAENPNVWVTYGWYIDDVRLVTNPGNDLVITETYWGTEGLNYYQIPLTQVAPIDFEVAAFNGGVNSQTNVVLNVNVNEGAFVGSSDPAQINSLDTAILTLSTQFTPDANGDYDIVQTISADSTDDVPGNNEIDDVSFSVVDFIYARDNGSPGGSTTNGADGFESGNLFDVWADQTLKAIDIRIPGGTNGAQLGTEFYVKLYSVDVTTGDFIYEMESDVLTLTQQMQNTSLTVPLLSPVNVIANTTYLAVIGSFGEGLRVSTAGTSEPQTSFFLDLADNTWYYQTGTPYVRMNFDPTIGIEENHTTFMVGNIFPNPVSGEGTLNVFMNNAQNMHMEITDISGKLVGSESRNLNQGENKIYLDTKQLSSGIYTVTLASGTTSLSRKMIVQ